MNHSQFGQHVTSTDSERESQPAALRVRVWPLSPPPARASHVHTVKAEQLWDQRLGEGGLTLAVSSFT